MKVRRGARGAADSGSAARNTGEEPAVAAIAVTILLVRPAETVARAAALAGSPATGPLA